MPMPLPNIRKFLGLTLVLAAAPFLPVQACSVFLRTHGNEAIVAKTLDWQSENGAIFVNKRNVLKKAALPDGASLPLEWVSRFMAVTYSQVSIDFPWEGLNEAGLSVHGLDLSSSRASPLPDSRPEVGELQWMQHILDTSASVDEAIANARKLRVSTSIKTHYFVCDPSADCAILEYLKGDLLVHRKGKDTPYLALTNDEYDASLGYLKERLAEAAGNRLSIVNAHSDRSLDRFARAALLSEEQPQSQETSVEHGFRSLDNLSETELPTVWLMVNDLNKRVAYIATRRAPHIKWVDLSQFDPDCASGAQVLDVNAPVSGRQRWSGSDVDRAGTRRFTSIQNEMAASNHSESVDLAEDGHGQAWNAHGHHGAGHYGPADIHDADPAAFSVSECHAADHAVGARYHAMHDLFV